MKNIFCFGDSNTFGFNPTDGSRYDKSSRWTGILQSLLKDDFKIINHGKNDRTFFSFNPNDPEISGLNILPSRLKGDIDTIIIALGANDTQKAYKNNGSDYIAAINKTVETINTYSQNTQIVLTAPPVIQESVLDSFFSTMFDKNSILKSEILPDIYKECAKKLNIKYIDFNEITPVSDTDGLHYTKEGHIKIANSLAEFISRN